MKNNPKNREVSSNAASVPDSATQKTNDNPLKTNVSKDKKMEEGDLTKKEYDDSEHKHEYKTPIGQSASKKKSSTQQKSKNNASDHISGQENSSATNPEPTA